MAKKEKPADDASMNAVFRVQLSDEAVAERARTLAEKLGIVATLRTQKKADGERTQTLIDQQLDEVEELRLEILDGAAEKRQGDLFVDEVVGVPRDVANASLAEGAKRAGEPPFDFAGDEAPEPPVQVNAKLEKSKRGEKGASA